MNEIISTVVWQDHIYIFTRDGSVYKMHKDPITWEVTFTKLANIFPTR